MSYATSLTLKKIEQIQNEFYSENGGKKSFFFKNKQKNDIANKICKSFNIDELLSESIYIIPEKQCIYLNYELVKTFLTEEMLNQLIDHLVKLYDISLRDYKDLKLHINLNGFTISASERYKSLIITIIQKFEEISLKSDVIYSKYIQSIFFYNTPSFINNFILIFKPFTSNQSVFEKMNMYTKKESETKLISLFNPQT
jgi:hypothetical protein